MQSYDQLSHQCLRTTANRRTKRFDVQEIKPPGPASQALKAFSAHPQPRL